MIGLWSAIIHEPDEKKQCPDLICDLGSRRSQGHHLHCYWVNLWFFFSIWRLIKWWYICTNAEFIFCFFFFGFSLVWSFYHLSWWARSQYKACDFWLVVLSWISNFSCLSIYSVSSNMEFVVVFSLYFLCSKQPFIH